MPVPKSMRRLLHVRQLEEEQRKAELESALGEQRRLEDAMGAAHDRERAGRAWIASSANCPDPADRIAGLVDSESAGHVTRILAPRAAAAAARTAALREKFLAVRVERRQVDTVIHEAEELEALQQDRKQQQGLDDWFGARRHSLAGKS
ncbi:MAG TPA: hypothetical protein VGJ21_09130 [Terracidiphilus sp.]|jgi:hypothetical protein